MDLLCENLAFITGGMNANCPILTFPDNPRIELTQEKYRKLVSYLTQVPKYVSSKRQNHFYSELSSETERQQGFVLIIDRRSDRWTAVKSLISYIEVSN